MNLKILDNFLEKQDLEDILSIRLKKITKNEIRVHHNSIDKNNNIKADCIEPEVLRRLQKNYHDKAMNLLKNLSPLKAKLYDYSEFHIIETGADYQFPIHDDTPNKLLSGVIYISPEKNSGTIFYENKKGDGKQIVGWKVNRAVFFSRIEKETWHSYKGNGKSNRIALVYNLMTNKIKEVYNIEQKSYLLGQLRYKLNPYIYRFFKFTI